MSGAPPGFVGCDFRWWLCKFKSLGVLTGVFMCIIRVLEQSQGLRACMVAETSAMMYMIKKRQMWF